MLPRARSLTVAPATALPAASRTTPFHVAVDCASPEKGSNKARKRNQTRYATRGEPMGGIILGLDAASAVDASPPNHVWHRLPPWLPAGAEFLFPLAPHFGHNDVPAEEASLMSIAIDDLRNYQS